MIWIGFKDLGKWWDENFSRKFNLVNHNIVQVTVMDSYKNNADLIKYC